MKVEIWSDVICPFCYIGKRRFEDALQHFENKDEIEIEWKSFQLNPDLETDTSINIDQYLADVKGWTIDHARDLNAHVTQMAAEAGLTYNFDKAVVANSFKAHRFSHLAKKNGLGIEAEEQLFKAYFTDGKNIDDLKHDIAEAQHLGIQGVPFFVMNNKYAVSGAQAVPVFEQTLQKAYADWQKEHPKPKFEVIEGESCGPDGNC